MAVQPMDSDSPAPFRKYLDKKKFTMNDKSRIKVYVGYAWQRVDHCIADERWSEIKNYFKRTNEHLETRYGVGIDFRRLRASHGRFIWDSVRDKILGADVLIFDVGMLPTSAVPTGKEISYKDFNANVILEMGAALANPNARMLLLCPKSLKNKIPTDISGLCYSSYIDKMEKDGIRRKYEDKWGVLPMYRSMVAEVIESKGWSVGNVEEDLNQDTIEETLKEMEVVK